MYIYDQHSSSCQYSRDTKNKECSFLSVPADHIIISTLLFYPIPRGDGMMVGGRG